MSETARQTTEEASGPRATGRDWIGLVVLALPCMLYAMDLTVLNLAIPSISAELTPTAAQLLWIVDIYGFMLAGSLLVMGALGDRIGRRKLLMIGSLAFGALSLLAAFSRSAEMLIAARALLGVAGATLAPSTLSLIRSMFRNERQRAVAVSAWVASFSAGGALGPVVGGLLLAHFWWGSVFLVALPVSVLILAIGPLVIPEYKSPGRERLDILSAVLALLAVLPTIYGIKAFAEGDSALVALAAIVIGLIFAAVFVRRQAALADPLLDLQMLRQPGLGLALGINLVDFFVGFGMLVLVAQYLQLVLGLSPLAAGLWSLPIGLGFIAGSFLTAPILAWLPRQRAVALGLAVGAFGLLVMVYAGGAHNLPLFIAGNVIMSLGSAPVTGIVADMVVGLAPEAQAGAAAALNETSSEFGGALGIALLGSLATYIYRSGLAATMPPGIPLDAAEMAMRGIGASQTVSDSAGPFAQALRSASQNAFGEALGIALVVGAALFILAAIAVVSGGASRQTASHEPA